MTTGLASLKVEIADGQDPMNTVTPSWTDITGSVQHISTNRGRDEQWQAHEPSMATLTFNAQNSSTFYPNTPSLIPNTPIRISMNDSTATRQFLFVGFIDPITKLQWDYSNTAGVTSFQCYDTLGFLARKQLPQLKTAIPGELFFSLNGFGYQKAGQAIAALDAAYDLTPAWASSSFADGQAMVKDFPLNTDALSVCQMLARADGGAFWVDKNGTLKYEDRYAAVSTYGTSQVTFDESGAGGAISFGLNFSVWKLPVYTTASVQLQDSTEVYSYSESATVDSYGTIAYPAITNCPLGSSTEAQSLAERLVRTSNAVVNGPKTCRVYPRRDNATLDCALQRDLRDRCLFKTTTAHMPSGANVHIERIQHDIDLTNNTWTTDFSFSSRDQLFFWFDINDPAWLVLDDATKGKLDGTRRFGW